MKTKYNKNILEQLVKDSITFSEVTRKLGLYGSGGNACHIKKIINYYKIDTSHFKGRFSSKGKSHISLRKKPEEYLIIYKNMCPKPLSIKNRLLRDGLKKHICEQCNLSEWQGKPILLELHHKNGNKLDFTLANIELLCSNCHAQTNNYSGRKKKVLYEYTKIENIEIKPKPKQKPIKNPLLCKKCNTPITKRTKHSMCNKCSHLLLRKVERPNLIELKKEIDATSFESVARKFKITSNAIRHWFQTEGISLK